MIESGIDITYDDFEALMIVVKGIFSNSECTLNGRVYPREIMEKEIEKIKEKMWSLEVPITLNVDWSKEYQGL